MAVPRARGDKATFPVATLLFAAGILAVAWQVTGFVPTEASLEGVAWSREAAREADYRALLLSIFAHGGLLHLGFNLLALVSLGPALERSVGTPWFAAVYLGSGIAGNVAHAASSPVPVVGASGAIFGLIGLLTLLRPRTEVALMLPIPMSAVMGSAIYVASVPFLLTLTAAPVAHVAHVGGMVAGMASGFLVAPLRALRTFPAVVAVFGAVWIGAGLVAQLAPQLIQGPPLEQRDWINYGAAGLVLLLALGAAFHYLERLDAGEGGGAAQAEDA